MQWHGVLHRYHTLARWPQHYAQCTQYGNKTVTLFNIALNCCEVRLSFSLSPHLGSQLFSFLFSLRYYLLPQRRSLFFRLHFFCAICPERKTKSGSHHRAGRTKIPNKKPESERSKWVGRQECKCTYVYTVHTPNIRWNVAKVFRTVLFALISIELHLIFGHSQRAACTLKEKHFRQFMDMSVEICSKVCAFSLLLSVFFCFSRTVQIL